MAADQASELPASYRDLLDATGVGALATIGPDGHPQVTAVWYLLENGALKLTMRDSRQKIKNLRARPQATLFFLDPDNPFRTLEVRGTVEITPDPDYTFADRVGKKYGADLRAFDMPGDHRVVVTLHPVKVNCRD